MSPDDQIPEPIIPTPVGQLPLTLTPAAGVEAEQFLSVELRDARRSLQITRIASVLASLFVIFYLGYITNRFQDSLAPDHAAEIAHGIIAQKVEDQAPQIAEQMKQQVPAMIERLPDYALQQIPQFRQKLSDQISGDLTGYAASTSTQLGAHLDDFLAANKEQVGQLIESGQDPVVTEQVGNELEHELMLYLKETPAGGGDSYQTKLDQSLSALEEVQAKMHKLAEGKNLTDDELKTRHIIAYLANGVDSQRVALTAK